MHSEFLDNIEDIQPYWDNKHLRKESALLDQISVFAIVGFSVKTYSIADDISVNNKNLMTQLEKL